MHYAHNLYSGYSGIPILGCTILLPGVSAFLNVMGITESARVALGIFLFHLLRLTVLTGATLFATGGDFPLLSTNLHATPEGGLVKALFFGFSAAMLGIQWL